jgi:hypothetical protein
LDLVPKASDRETVVRIPSNLSPSVKVMSAVLEVRRCRSRGLEFTPSRVHHIFCQDARPKGAFRAPRTPQQTSAL